MRAALAIIVLLAAVATASGERLKIHVVDGDTIGFSDGRPNARLIGFDTPETFRPECPAERALARKAKERLRRLIAGGAPELEYVQCSCRPGTHGTDRCNYGRDCARLFVGGQDVAYIMISEGLAKPFICTANRCPQMPDWC